MKLHWIKIGVNMTISLPLRRQSKGENIAGWTRTNFSPISQFRKCHSPVVAVGRYGWDRVCGCFLLVVPTPKAITHSKVVTIRACHDGGGQLVLDDESCATVRNAKLQNPKYASKSAFVGWGVKTGMSTESQHPWKFCQEFHVEFLQNSRNKSLDV